METYHRKRSRRGSTIEAANNVSFPFVSIIM